MKIFCLIPALNEKGNLELLVNSLSNILSKHTRGYKIFFVVQGNDGSIDLLKKIKLKNKNLDWIYYKKALGVGRAYLIGFNKIDSKFTHVLTLDADLNHDPKAIPGFIQVMEKNRADLVIGSRFMKGGIFNDNRRWKRVISFFMNKIMIFMVKIKIHDISSGFRLMKLQLINEIKNELKEKGYPSYMELIICAAKQGFTLAEVPIVYKARIWGKSKMGKIKTFYDYFLFLQRVFFTL